MGVLLISYNYDLFHAVARLFHVISPWTWTDGMLELLPVFTANVRVRLLLRRFEHPSWVVRLQSHDSCGFGHHGDIPYRPIGILFTELAQEML